MINQGIVTMEFKIYALIFLFLTVSLVSAGGISQVEQRQILLNEKLDSSYRVSEEGSFHKQLRQNQPIVYIDKKVGTTYHVDSLKDLEEDESVTLIFYYEIQPDYIEHYKHSGEFDTTYYPKDWNWTSNCSGEEWDMVCIGGWVTLEGFNIDAGTGSNTYPIGITGPTWQNDGILNTLVNGVDYTLDTTTGLLTLGSDYVYDYIVTSWSYYDTEKNQDYNLAKDTEQGIGEFGEWFIILITVSIAGFVLYLLFGTKGESGGY